MTKSRATWLSVLLLVSAVADAKTLYVDRASGNDATTYANNSATSPWASLGRATWGSANRSAPNPSEAARAGDTVIVRAGTYTTTGTGIRFEPAFNPVNSGTTASPIKFKAEGAVNLAFSSGVGPVIGALNVNNIVWSGFTVNEVNAPSTPDTGPVVLWSTYGSVIENCVIVGRGNINRGDNYPGIRIENSMDIVVRNNSVSNFLPSPGINSPAVQLYRAGRVIIENNEFFSVGNGVAFKYTSDLSEPQFIDWFVVRYNVIRDSYAGVWVHRTGNNPYIHIYQNIFRDVVTGLNLHAFGDGTDPRNVSFVNNTIQNVTQGGGITVQYGLVPGAGHVVQNNIVTGSQMAVLFNDNTDTLSTQADRILFRNNVYFGNRYITGGVPNATTLATWRANYGQDAGSVEVDPMFVGAGVGSFKLQSGSPARTVGIDVLDLDHDGSRNDTIPAGAYITGNETIGRADSGTNPLVPAAPNNVVVE